MAAIPQKLAGDTKRYAIVLSDIHIGDNSPACWYQAKYHDAYLNRALQFVIDNAPKIKEVVLLGDVFDVWTYPPHVRPPGMREILKANPTLLGPTGKLAEVCRTLPNEVRLVLGNHDGTLTAADIDLLNTNMGFTPGKPQAIKFLASGIRFYEGSLKGRTIFSHGHFWCMFNAPDPDVPKWGTLPVGHFVTRAISYHLHKTMKAGKTAADLPDHGIPPTDWLKLIDSWRKSGSDVVPKLLDYICAVTKMKETEKIVMPDGSVSSVKEAKTVYANLWDRWFKRVGGRPIDTRRAAAADKLGPHLAWFAQRLAMKYGADLAVFGHTHAPVGGLITSPVNYFNSGYECVALPDMPAKQFTFTAVDLDLAAAEVWEVSKTSSGTYGVKPHPAPPANVIVRPAEDYSCYVRIENATKKPLKRVGNPKVADGYWVVPPPKEIAPGERADLWLQDELGAKGSAGGFTYDDGFGPLDFSFSCPYLFSDNKVSSPVANWKSKVGTGPWRTAAVEAAGHPVQVQFTVMVETGLARAPKRKPAGVAVA